MERVSACEPCLALPLQRGGLPYLTPQQLFEVLGSESSLTTAAGSCCDICFTVSAFDCASLVDILPAVCPTNTANTSANSPLLQLWDLIGTPQLSEVDATSTTSTVAAPKETTTSDVAGGGRRTAPPLILTAHKGGPALGLTAADNSGLTGTTEGGRHQLDPKGWAKIVKAVKPDLAVALGQPELVLDGPMAKLRRLTVARNETWYSKCLAASKEDEDGTTTTTTTVTQVIPNFNAMVLQAGEYWPPLVQEKTEEEKRADKKNKKKEEKEKATAEAPRAATTDDVTVPAPVAAAPSVEPKVGQKRDRRTMEILEPTTGCELEKKQPAEWCYLPSGNMGESQQVRAEYIEAAVLQNKEINVEGASKKKVIAPCETVEAIVHALTLGATVVESSLPFALAARGLALNLDQDKIVAEAALKLSGTRKQDQGGITVVASGLSSGCVEILNLWDMIFEVDQEKLKGSCGMRGNCFTCQRHSRSYIHHLLLLQELNGCTLLALHNLSELVQLFRIWRKEMKK